MRVDFGFLESEVFGADGIAGADGIEEASHQTKLLCSLTFLLVPLHSACDCLQLIFKEGAIYILN